jgi:hypothetical protein
MLPPTIVHSSKRILRPASILPLLEHSYFKQGDQYLLPFRCHVISHHKMLIDGHFPFPIWNVIARNLLQKPTKFPFVYGVDHSHVMEWEPSSFTKYDVLIQGKCYRHAAQLWHDVPAPTYTLLFSIDHAVAEELILNKLM